MHFKEILTYITGLSIPILGVQWKPLTADVTIARNVLDYLADRRVLYNPYIMEGLEPCIFSATQIRNYLTNEIRDVKKGEALEKELKNIRKACGDFCDMLGGSKFDKAPQAVQDSLFMTQLAMLRRSVGKSIAVIAVSYELDIPDDLAVIIPFNNPSGTRASSSLP